MKKNMTKLAVRSIALGALIGIIAGSAALADQETRPATVANNSVPCVGKYTAFAKMTNAYDGTTWIVPPTNTVVTNGLFSDLSGIPQPYASFATVVPPASLNYSCGSNHVKFAATNGGKYQLMVVITNSPSPVTNGQTLTLDVQWNVP